MRKIVFHNAYRFKDKQATTKKKKKRKKEKQITID